MREASFRNHSLNLKGRLYSFDQPQIMAILNVTPDSFYAESASTRTDELLGRADRFISDGADILDIGGMSSRPGAEIISPQTEINRVLPFLKSLRNKYPDIIISIDTLHSKTADAALHAGADIINDISGAKFDPEILDVAAEHSAPYVCMHMRGTPKTMVDLNKYEDLVRDLFLFFRERILRLKEAGIKDIIIDPGFGFAKNIRQNFKLLNKLHLFQVFDLPVMIGISRKSFIYKSLGVDPDEALNGTTVLHTLAIQQGIQILRVHDPKAVKDVVKLTKKAYQPD